MRALSRWYARSAQWLADSAVVAGTGFRANDWLTSFSRAALRTRRSPATITVTLQQPAEPRVARALALLTDQINNNPPQMPQMPGDTRPITYQLTAKPAI